MAETSYEVHSYSTGRWRMESAYDEKELAVTAATMLLDEQAQVDRVRVVEEIPNPKGGKSTYRLVMDRDRAGSVAPPLRPAKPAAPGNLPRRTSQSPAAPPTTKVSPATFASTAPVLASLPRRPIAPSPAPVAATASPAVRKVSKKPDPAAAKAASKVTSQIILYFLVAGGLALGALAAMTFAKQLIRLL